MDRHWQPFHRRCAFCTLRYDFVGRTEDFRRDWDRVLAASNATADVVADRDLVLNRSLGEGESEGNRTARYFSRLTAESRVELYYAYRNDFELFGYDPEPYLSQI